MATCKQKELIYVSKEVNLQSLVKCQHSLGLRKNPQNFFFSLVVYEMDKQYFVLKGFFFSLCLVQKGFWKRKLFVHLSTRSSLRLQRGQEVVIVFFWRCPKKQNLFAIATFSVCFLLYS